MAPKATTRNPPELRPTPIAPNLARKEGAGVRYIPGGRIGPIIQTPPIAHAAQSGRANALESAAPTINRSERNTRTIPRDSLAIPQRQNYGKT
jgi:hypothetical protein